MKNLPLTLADDFYSMQVAKVKGFNGHDNYTYYDISLTVRAKYDGPLNGLGKPDKLNDTHNVKLTGLRSLNTALEMLGFKPLPKDDEQLLTEYIATRGDYGRRKNVDFVQSSGTMDFAPDYVTIYGIQGVEFEGDSIYDKSGDLEAKSFKEILDKIKENNSQPE